MEFTQTDPHTILRFSIAIDALSQVFEYLLGLTVQLWIILRCDLWIRGTNLGDESTLDFVLRRFSAVLRWAVALVLLTLALVQMPLVAVNLDFLPVETVFPWIENRARPLITTLVLGTCSVQAALAFHADHLWPALRHHILWFRKNGLLAIGFILVAFAHLAALNLVLATIKRAIGDTLSLTNIAFLGLGGIKAFCFAWLLCSWICFFRRTQRRLQPGEPLARY